MLDNETLLIVFLRTCLTQHFDFMHRTRSHCFIFTLVVPPPYYYIEIFQSRAMPGERYTCPPGYLFIVFTHSFFIASLFRQARVHS